MITLANLKKIANFAAHIQIVYILVVLAIRDVCSYPSLFQRHTGQNNTLVGTAALFTCVCTELASVQLANSERIFTIVASAKLG